MRFATFPIILPKGRHTRSFFRIQRKNNSKNTYSKKPTIREISKAKNPTDKEVIAFVRANSAPAVKPAEIRGISTIRTHSMRMTMYRCTRSAVESAKTTENTSVPTTSAITFPFMLFKQTETVSTNPAKAPSVQSNAIFCLPVSLRIYRKKMPDAKNRGSRQPARNINTSNVCSPLPKNVSARQPGITAL